jgi:hypothetical protein
LKIAKITSFLAFLIFNFTFWQNFASEKVFLNLWCELLWVASLTNHHGLGFHVIENVLELEVQECAWNSFVLNNIVSPCSHCLSLVIVTFKSFLPYTFVLMAIIANGDTLKKTFNCTFYTWDHFLPNYEYSKLSIYGIELSALLYY